MARVDFKVVMLGKSGVGKTCLVRRYLDGVFSTSEASTVGASYFSKRCNFKPPDSSQEVSVLMGIWDTAGQERFDSMTKIYYRGAQAAVVCYDLTDAQSLERAKFWINELLVNVESPCRIYLVGTKADLIKEPEDRALSQEEVNEYAESVEASLHVETSSKSGAEIENLFQLVALNWYEDHPNEQSEDPSFVGLGGGAPQQQAPCEC